MIILRINVQNVSAVLAAGYDEIVLYSDTEADGTFTDVVGAIPLAPNQTNYDYEDQAGDLNTWYEVAYHDTAIADPDADPPVVPVTDSPKSDPFQGITSRGPLGFLSIGYLRANTDFPILATLSDSKLAEYIWRAESLIQRWADQYGGFNVTLPNYGTMLAIAARMVVENIYVMSNPQARARRANGLQSERIGSYQYTVAKGFTVSGNAFDFGPEILAIMMWYLYDAGRMVSMKATQVFIELPGTAGLTPDTVGVTLRPWHDFTDIQLMRSTVDAGVWIEDPLLRYAP